MTKISIIVPVYNVEKYLERCLDSIISQTLADLEIILATDGPENCDKICQQYAQKDNRIKVLQNPGSYGKGFNRGLEIASGEYIGIVEADDWCNPEMFEKLYKKAKEYNADVVKCGFVFSYDNVSMNKTVVPDEIFPEDFSVYDYPEFLESQPSVWNCIYKKSFLKDKNIKMIEKRQPFIDAPFHYETLYMAEKYILLKEPLYYYYQGNANQSVQNVKPFDGLNSEKYAYARIIQNPKIWNELKEGFLYATTAHLLWNYERIKDEKDRSAFWLEAHNYLNGIDLSGFSFYYFYNNDLKKFFLELKNKRNGKYEPVHINSCPRSNTIWVKLFNIIPFLKIKLNQIGFKSYLFGLLPLVEFKKRYSYKIKLFNLFYIIAFYRTKNKESSIKTLLRNIFSIRNSENKKHKILTICGVKMKFKRKKYIEKNFTESQPSEKFLPETSISSDEAADENFPAEDLLCENSVSIEEQMMLNDSLYKSFPDVYMLAKDCLWKLLKEYEFKTVLDLGAGEGIHTNIFLNNNKDVTAIIADRTYFNVGNYQNIQLIEQDYMKTNFEQKFDCIWASHILEHQFNIGMFLRKIYSDLNDNGILAISVPPCETLAGGGHINIFSPGSLIYHLVSNGFDLSDMRLKVYGYNLSIICRKDPDFNFNDNNFSVYLKEYYKNLPDYVIKGIEEYVSAHPAPWGGHERIPDNIEYKW